MNDKELCKIFGLTIEDIEQEIAAVESGDLTAFDFGRATIGRPMSDDKMDSISLKIPRSRITAIDRIAKEQGVTRSEFVRRAIDRQLVAIA